MSTRTLFPVILGSGGPSGNYAVNLNMTIDENYIISAQLVDQNGDALGTEQTIDLPLESVVVGGSYDSSTQSLILTLDNGQSITIPVSGLISGLQATIDSNNPLNVDYTTDGTTNKVYTAAEQSKLSGIAAGAEVNVQSDWNQSDSTADDYIKNKPTIPTVDVTAAGDNTFTGNNTFTNTVSVGGTDIADGSISAYDQQAGSGFVMSGTNLSLIVPDLGMEDSFSIMLDDSTGEVTLYVGNSNGLEITGSPVTVNGNQVATTDMLPSGTDDGTNWTTLTISGVTKNIPSGGGGGSVWYGSQEQFDLIPEVQLDQNTTYYISGKLDYDKDLTNKPVIPTNTNQLTNGADFQDKTQVSTEVMGGLGYLDKTNVYLTQTEFDTMRTAGTLKPGYTYHIQGDMTTVQMVVTFTDQSTATYDVFVKA